jgi:predicted RNA binding protein YcfA (HicA-like mRNA interferase family)
MGRLAPVSHRALVTRLEKLGFAAPYSGGKHLIMVKCSLCLVIPNVHGPKIGPDLLSRILRQAEISGEDWEEAEA